MIGIEQTSVEELLEPMHDEIGMLRERWAGITLADVYAERPASEHVEVSRGHYVEAATLEPVDGEYDGTDVVFPLHYMQGWTAHHYIGVRVVQELVFPNSRVTVLPNGPDSVVLDDEDKRQMAIGINVPAERQMRLLERCGLGKTAIAAFSDGGLTGLRLAGQGSDSLELTRVNIDDMPHKAGRDDKGVRKDFGPSSGIRRLRGAINSADIPALSEAMSPLRLAKDISRFVWRAFATENGRLGRQDMAGTHNGEIARAVHQLGGRNVKLSGIYGSFMFVAEDVDLSLNSVYHPVPAGQGPRVVQYTGEGFYAHAAVDDPILRAGMVYDGLKSVVKTR